MLINEYEHKQVYDSYIRVLEENAILKANQLELVENTLHENSHKRGKWLNKFFF